MDLLATCGMFSCNIRMLGLWLGLHLGLWSGLHLGLGLGLHIGQRCRHGGISKLFALGHVRERDGLRGVWGGGNECIIAVRQGVVLLSE